MSYALEVLFYLGLMAVVFILCSLIDSRRDQKEEEERPRRRPPQRDILTGSGRRAA